MTVPSKATPPVGSEQGPVPEDALRTMVETVVQEALELEFTRFLGAAPHERTDARRGWRNGVRERTLLTRVGTLTLRVPRDRDGAFQPALFARYQRSEQALVLALAEMYVQGVSTRKVSAIIEQLCGTTLAASTVSAATRTLDASLAAWRTRRLDGTRYPYLIIDAHHERIRREGQVRSTAALWVIGVRADGYREHLGIWLGASESAASWGAVFRDLARRGLRGVCYAVADEHAGLLESLHRVFPDAVVQRCTVHYLRNALAKVTAPLLAAQLKDGLRDVWAAPTRPLADQRAAVLIAALRPLAPSVTRWLEETIGDTLAFYALPEPEARRRLKTTNAIEHDHAEVRRRTRVIRIFPNEPSFERLASALAIERGEQWAARRYVIMAAAPTPKEKRLKRSA